MNNSNIVPSNLSRDPFRSLFLEFLESCDSNDIPSKTKAIQDFVRDLEELESNSENEHTFLHWSSIFSVFSAAGVISGITVLNPFLGLAAATSAAASAIGVVSLAIAQHHERQPILERLRKYRIALNSDQAINWACLWEFARTDIFLGSLYAASAGHLEDNRTLIRNDGKNPMAAALDSCCQYYGLTRDELIDAIRKLKSGVSVKCPTVPKALEQVSAITVLQADAPTVLQPSGEDLNPLQNALDILEGLVKDADKSKLGGCVILAAPGAGKTTFLGTAWGRLKKIYGTKFKSLSIVVKSSDLQAFQACSDKALCIHDSVIDAAIAVIKFISQGKKTDGYVKRLFIDDFLTANQYFQMSLKGKFINPRTLQIYFDKKTAIELEDNEAVPMIDCFYSSLNEAWLVGREYNLCLWVSSHSSNVDALPFVGSRESRSVGDLIFLAKNDKREFIEQAMNNPNLIGDNQKRQQLKQVFTTQVASDNEPWVLANFNNWRLGIVPKDIYEEYQAYRSTWFTASEVISELEDEERETLEQLFQMEVKDDDKRTDDDPKQSVRLSNDAELLLSYFNNVKVKSPKSVKDLKDANKLRELNHQQLMKALAQLVAAEILDVDEDGNYLKVDW
ncbi:hypothetical protein NIES2100_73770 [Calothrix sp. NIES-2100]|uniref:hypothetical protein n=1 Tax=Calothrix sp. NIES-2100 TaxID=1954172 RepID=UPI000B60029E|nr:hypothetical protein NIES2100_73770 [Calothrix sp. NIES-2100]